LRLLRDWLSPDQREQLDNSGYFEVLGCASRKRYRIYHVKVAPNVYEIDGAGRIKEGLCFLPVGPLVTGDVQRDSGGQQVFGSPRLASLASS